MICPDVGGGFGLKINVHDDEIATAAISRLLGRPVKYCADRVEAFGADAHSRDHRVRGRIAVSEGGEILAMEVDDLSAIGAFTAFIRFGIAEGMMTITNAGAPYRVPAYRGAMRAAYVNKPIVGMYRGVGVPIACAVTEQLCDMAACAIGMDPVAFRRINFLDPDSLPAASVGGIRLPRISFAEALDRLVEVMDYGALRAEQAALRARGIHRGIGVATFIEPTAYGPGYYGPSEAPVSTQEGTTVKLEPSGKIRCITSVTDQGQGTLTGIAQIVADQLGVDIADVDVIAGDSATTPFGGGAWASRGLAMGGEASLAAALALKENVLALAGPILQTDPASLDLRDGGVVDRDGGTARLTLREVARIGHFRQDTLPADLSPSSRRPVTMSPTGRITTSRTGLSAATSNSTRRPVPSTCSASGWPTNAGALSIRCWSTSSCGAGSSRGSERRSSRNASTIPPASCSTARSPITSCRWRAKCPTS